MPRALFNEAGIHIDWLQDFDPEPDNMGRINIGEDDLGEPEWAIVEDIALNDPRIDPNIEQRGIDFPQDVDEAMFARPDVPPPPLREDEGVRLNADPVLNRIIEVISRDKTFKNGPELWDFLLHNVREIYECDACVAGGAVRDYLLGIPPKDIDIFIDHNFPDIVQQNMPELNFGHGFNKTHNEYEHSDTEIKGVWQFHVRGHAVDLIARPIPKENYVEELLKTFDFDICKSAYKDGQIIDLGEKDRENKTFTFSQPNPTDHHYEQAHRRYRRFIERTGMTDFREVGMTRLEDIIRAKKEAEEKRRRELEKFQKNYGGSGSIWSIGTSTLAPTYKYYGPK